jgi:two-component system sensor histidine kinase KdpD
MVRRMSEVNGSGPGRITPNAAPFDARGATRAARRGVEPPRPRWPLTAPHRPARWLAWVGWLSCLALATTGMVFVRARLDEAHVALVFLLVVLGASAGGGRALGLTIAVAAFLSFNYLFLPPYLTFVIADPLDWLVLVTFLVTSVVAAQLLYRATSTADAAVQRAAEVDRLAALGAETLNLPSPEAALRAILDVIRATLGLTSCDIFVQGDAGAFVVASRSTAGSAGVHGQSPPGTAGEVQRRREPPARNGAATDSTHVAGLVRWIFEHGRGAVELADGAVRIVDDPAREATRAGAAGEVRVLSIPLAVRGETVGVLRMHAAHDLTLTHEQARFLDALSYYAALGVDRARLVADAERSEAERRVEALRSALLTAVSHDLRTPLTTIKAIAHEIANGGPRDRARVIEEESDRLDALVGDLLDLSRIQSGALHPSPDVNTVDDLIGAALRRADALLRSRHVDIDLPSDQLLTGRFDLTNSLRALVNLIENACRYSPAGSPITIRGRREDGVLRVSVLDRGPGVPFAERERIFEPFYRPRGTSPDVRGTGLGLSIARGLAEAQGGAVEFEPRDAGGSCFSLLMPAANGVTPGESDVRSGVHPER